MYPFRWVPTRALDSVKPFRKVWVGVFAACYPGRWCLLLACCKNVHCSLWFLRRCVKFGLCSISSIASKSAVVIHFLLYTVYCIICVSICLGPMKTLKPYMRNMTKLFDHRASSFFSPRFWYSSISVVRIEYRPLKFNRVRPLKMDAGTGRGSKILLGFGPCSHLLCLLKFSGEICTSKALLVAGCRCFF